MSSPKRAKNKPIKKSKKTRISKRKILILVCFMSVFTFSFTKLISGVNQTIKNINIKQSQEKEEQKEEEIKQKQFDLESEKPKNSAKKFTVLVDPGHGGNDKGTQSNDKSVFEKDLSLQIGKKVAAKLAKHEDIQVIISRLDDTYISLSDRAKLANEQNADVLVSVHLNAEGGGSSASGAETYYRTGAKDGSDKLAKRIQESIVSFIAIRDRGIREDLYQVLTDSHMPAVLVECGFLTNDKERDKLLSEDYQDKLSEAIAQGTLAYLDENLK